MKAVAAARSSRVGKGKGRDIEEGPGSPAAGCREDIRPYSSDMQREAHLLAHSSKDTIHESLSRSQLLIAIAAELQP